MAERYPSPLRCFVSESSLSYALRILRQLTRREVEREGGRISEVWVIHAPRHKKFWEIVFISKQFRGTVEDVQELKEECGGKECVLLPLLCMVGLMKEGGETGRWKGCWIAWAAGSATRR